VVPHQDPPDREPPLIQAVLERAEGYQHRSSPAP
jgi:hypothetical protein